MATLPNGSQRITTSHLTFKISSGKVVARYSSLLFRAVISLKKKPAAYGPTAASAIPGQLAVNSTAARAPSNESEVALYCDSLIVARSNIVTRIRQRWLLIKCGNYAKAFP
jgi:hypothetical protein